MSFVENQDDNHPTRLSDDVPLFLNERSLALRFNAMQSFIDCTAPSQEDLDNQNNNTDNND